MCPDGNVLLQYELVSERPNRIITEGVTSPRCREGNGGDPLCLRVPSAQRVRGGDCSIPPVGSIDFPAQQGDVGNVSL